MFHNCTIIKCHANVLILKLYNFNIAKSGRKTVVSKYIRDIIIDTHNKGYSVRDIVKYIKKEKDVNISKTTVQRIISDYKIRNREIDKNKSEEVNPISVQKPNPVNNIFIGDKMDDDYQKEVVKKVKPPMTDRIYQDYMETLEETDIIKELKVRYLAVARKNSMSFYQFLRNACELENQYLEKEIMIVSNKFLTDDDVNQVLKMIIIAKALNRL